jgi:phenylalanine-4-hydroxylase
MDAIGFDENRDTVLGLNRICVCRNAAADKGYCEVEPDDKERPCQDCPNGLPKSGYVKKFQLIPVPILIALCYRLPMADALHVYDQPPPHANADWTISQDWEAFSADDHAMWDTLFARQSDMLPGRAADAFLRGLDVLRLSKPGIPDYRELNTRLMAATGWQVVAVPGLVPDAVFFDHLAHRRFPAGNFIRRPDQLDYLQEPDVFHDVFGHVPMLADPVFADYMQAYGQGGLRSLGFGALHKLARLYWYTVEFGLIQEAGGLRIYGAGIVSSYGESVFALESDSPNWIAFDLSRVMRTQYRIDDYQQSYFVIPNLDELLRVTVETDFAPLYKSLESLEDYGVADIASDDTLITHGTQEHVRGPTDEGGKCSRSPPLPRITAAEPNR